MLSDKSKCLLYLFLAHSAGVTENDGRGMLYLIDIELTEVLYIHLAFTRIAYSSKGVKLCAVGLNSLDGLYNVRKLSDARRLDKDPVGGVLVKHLLKSLTEISDETATDTS